ncbi:hypothetical protein BU25DRAFT_377630 [Macroventuria anomochaeta]|uniref:Uncharacterized protein n=1 Tax=Macroventuria anomochaeta TaxID=301207 RepID=A0ACB6RL80_9PLEO|nr:uncharacterized protein BU25DRAFT_377630 [Macroventuria anomochaeta]KAF2622483.1 hypothetical protein BU25DRAFT_377630 [Macroventuria anomochaeta]
MGRGRDDPEPTFDEDKDLDEIWPQVVQQYEKITRQKLDPRTTFAAFQIQIDEDIQRSATKSHQHARKVLNNVGYCLEQFGNIIVQGASIVFGPTAQCWNAISFVITAARKFGDVLDGFVTLMERSSAFLQRLNFFLQQERDKSGSRLPNHLRKPAYDILSQFLGVLRSSYSLATSRRERLKTMVGVLLFNSDAGVAESLNLMEMRIKDFTNAQVDQILVDVKGLARYLRESDEDRKRHQSEIQEYLEHVYRVNEQVLNVTQDMKATIDGRTTKDQHNDDKSKIWKSLAFQKPGEQDSWDKRHNEICKVRVKDTGKWLELVDGFMKWADINQHENKVLLLKADSGFGKTYVSNHVISYLQETYRAGAGPNQTYLAYYYYGADKDDSLEKCVGSIIHQFAAVDVGYAKAVANACGRPASTARAEDRWKHLVQRLQNHMKGIYFVCIDGLDGRGQPDNLEATVSTIVHHATSQTGSGGVSIRLFISGSDEALSKSPQGVEGIRIITLDPSEDPAKPTALESDREDQPRLTPLLNASDLEAVTRARVMDICKTKPDLKAILNESNIQLLVENIRGNYARLEAKMTEINACDTERKVQEVINNDSDDINTVQRNNLKALDASLDSNQVRKLNELLVWVSGMIGSPSIKFLQSALYFALGEKFLLESEVATTYSALLKIDKEGGVSFKSDDYKDILSASDAPNPGSALTDLHTEEISRAEVDLCRRFIRNACDAVDYTRFKFDEFFDTMAHKVHIYLGDQDVVSVTIIGTCVDVLCDTQKDENLGELRDYASKWFYEHLKTLVERLDDFEPNRQSLTEIGAKLVDLFYEPDLIDAWFLKTNLTWLKYDWLYQDDFIDPLLKFWKNPHVAKGYGKHAKKSEWVRKVVADSANKYLILERVAARLANHWFSCTTTAAPDYLWISYGIIVKGAGKSFDENTPPTLLEVDHFIQWVKMQDFDLDDYTWAYRKGATNLTFQHYREAIRAFEEAEQHPRTSWGVALGLSRAHEQLKDFHAALQYIQKFKSFNGPSFEIDKEYRLAYWSVLLAEGDCYRQCQDYDPAVKCFRDILDQDVDAELWPGSVHEHALSGLFTTWTEMKSYRSITDFMRSWRNAENKERGLIYWFQKTARVDKIHGCIIVAAKHVEAVEEICSLYQDVIDHMAASTSTIDDQGDGLDPYIRGQLQYFQAALRFHGSRSQHNHDRGIQLWEEIIRRSDDPSSSWWTAYNASRKLAPCLLDKAVTETPAASSSPSESYVSKLEALAKLNNTVIRNNRQGQTDPRLCLTRLYRLKGNHQSAFAEAQARLCSVFDKWPEDANDDSLQLRFQNLAQTLTVLDKDIDAVAAWQATSSHQSQKPCTTDASATDALKPANPNSSGVHPVPPLATSVDKAENDPGVFTSVDATPKAYISGYDCDGECETQWKDMLADCWVCKHCLCVQLCSACYGKLQADDLHPLICNKEHKLLYLPPFDQNMWQSISSDMIIIDKQPVPRLQWLNKIRDEYGVQQEQIDMLKIEKARELKAATCIARHILRWRRKLLKIRAARQPTVPTLRRARTIV